MEKIRVAICDDLAFVCKSYALILETDGGIEFCGEAHGSEECISLVEKVSPDILSACSKLFWRMFKVGSAPAAFNGSTLTGVPVS